ncbi:hypothetical protein D3C85_1709980 [compost metagenome]
MTFTLEPFVSLGRIAECRAKGGDGDLFVGHLDGLDIYRLLHSQGVDAHQEGSALRRVVLQ